MCAQATGSDSATDSTGTTSVLEPFHGLICPGIGFKSGHTIWLFRFEETPTPIGGYSEVYLEEPDGTLTLYTDPGEAATYVTDYHEFDRIEAAVLDWERADHDELAVAMEADDGTRLDVRATLEPSLRSRVMDALIAVTPEAVGRTRLGNTVSSLSYARVMGSGGTKLRGHTETGCGYWGDADLLLPVVSASATLDGTDLGGMAPSRSTRELGDIRTSTDPHVVFGRLHLEYPAAGQPVTA
jgi:hypothetical protein